MADERTPGLLCGLKEITFYTRRCKEKVLEWQARPAGANPFPMYKVDNLWTANKRDIDAWWERELARVGRAA